MGRSGGGAAGGGGGGFSGGGRASGGFSGGSRSGGRSSSGGGRPPMGFGPMGPLGPMGPMGPRRYRGGSSGSFWGGMLGGMIGSSLGGSGRRTTARQAPAPAAPQGQGGAPGAPVSPAGQAGAPASSGGCGCGTVFIAVCAVLLVLALATSFGCTPSSCSGPSGAYPQASSTHERTALPQGTAEVTPLYTDRDGDWVHNTSQLEGGMEEFWRLTGVRPYLVILPNGTTASTGRLTEMAEQVYDESFSDEGHFVLVFCDNGSGGYNCGYSVGSAARSVMDDEACRILAKELDRAYGDRSLSEEQIFSQAFERTAVQIMADPAEGRRSGLMLAGGLGVCIVGAGGYMLWRRRRARQKERDRHLDEMLNKPLETFGDQDLADLEKKYADKASGSDDETTR